MAVAESRSTAELVMDVADDLRMLIRKEIELARIELMEGLKAQLIGAGLIALAIVSVLPALLFGLFALVYWLPFSRRSSYAIVGGGDAARRGRADPGRYPRHEAPPSEPRQDRCIDQGGRAVGSRTADKLKEIEEVRGVARSQAERDRATRPARRLRQEDRGGRRRQQRRRVGVSPSRSAASAVDARRRRRSARSEPSSRVMQPTASPSRSTSCRRAPRGSPPRASRRGPD